MKAMATRINKSWQEDTYDELEGAPKLTRSRMTNMFEGDLEGESWEEYLLVYRGPESCLFISLERVIGKLGDRSGSFVVQGQGTYQDGITRASLTIIPGSGTGDLKGLRGYGNALSIQDEPSIVTFDYELI